MEKTLYSPQGRIIAQTIAEIRNKAGLTQRELADRLGRERSVVASCELGQRRVDLAEFYWICKACGVAPNRAAAKLMQELDKI